jgi:hypothetical protein
MQIINRSNQLGLECEKLEKVVDDAPALLAALKIKADDSDEFAADFWRERYIEKQASVDRDRKRMDEIINERIKLSDQLAIPARVVTESFAEERSLRYFLDMQEEQEAIATGRTLDDLTAWQRSTIYGGGDVTQFPPLEHVLAMPDRPRHRHQRPCRHAGPLGRSEAARTWSTIQPPKSQPPNTSIAAMLVDGFDFGYIARNEKIKAEISKGKQPEQLSTSQAQDHMADESNSSNDFDFDKDLANAMKILSTDDEISSGTPLAHGPGSASHRYLPIQEPSSPTPSSVGAEAPSSPRVGFGNVESDPIHLSGRMPYRPYIPTSARAQPGGVYRRSKGKPAVWYPRNYMDQDIDMLSTTAQPGGYPPGLIPRCIPVAPAPAPAPALGATAVHDVPTMPKIKSVLEAALEGFLGNLTNQLAETFESSTRVVTPATTTANAPGQTDATVQTQAAPAKISSAPAAKLGKGGYRHPHIVCDGCEIQVQCKRLPSTFCVSCLQSGLPRL